MVKSPSSCIEWSKEGISLLLFLQILIVAATAAIGFGVFWSMYRSLRIPVRAGRGTGVSTVVTAQGSADGLEQTLKSLVWLEENGIVVARILIVDCGMDDEGLALARFLAKKHANIVISKPEEVQRWIMETSS